MGMLPTLSILLFGCGFALIPFTVTVAGVKRMKRTREVQDVETIVDEFISDPLHSIRRRWKHPDKVVRALSSHWDALGKDVQYAIQNHTGDFRALLDMMNHIDSPNLPEQVDVYRAISVFGAPSLAPVFQEGLAKKIFAIQRFSLIGLLRIDTGLSIESKRALASYAMNLHNQEEILTIALRCLHGLQQISVSDVERQFGFPAWVIVTACERLNIEITDITQYQFHIDSKVRIAALGYYEARGIWPSEAEELLKDRDPLVRAKAIEVVDATTHVEALSVALFDVVESVRIVAIERLMDLGSIGVEQVVKAYRSNAMSTQSSILRVFVEGLYMERWIKESQENLSSEALRCKNLCEDIMRNQVGVGLTLAS